MTITSVSQHCVDFIKGFEGFFPNQYDDGKGVLTIGYGTTKADVDPLPEHLSEPEAAAFLENRLNAKYLPPVVRALAPMKPTRNMVEACTSFAYNLGAGAFAGAPNFETLQRAIHAKSKQAIADAFPLYSDPPGSPTHAGLLRRREAERTWLLTADGPPAPPADPWAGYPKGEADAMHEYDGLRHANKNPERQTALRAEMTQMRQNIWHAAQPAAKGGDGKGWGVNERQARYRSLLSRTS